MLCVAVIVIAAMVALVVILSKPKGSKPQKTQNSPSGITKPNHPSFLLYIGISIIIAIWTIWGALFFLATVWLLRLDPKPHQKEIPYPSDLDKDSAKGIYAWLLLSPFLTVPTMIVAALNLDWNSSPNQRVFAALVPAIFHLALLLRFDSKKPFVYRHAQQAIFLVALRAGMASIALSIGTYPGDGAWLFFLGNGSLWLFGSLWGRNQAIHKNCWWMKRKDETILPPDIKPGEQSVTTTEPITTAIKKNKPAIEGALHTFRTGTPEERKQAILSLSQLGEVETF